MAAVRLREFSQEPAPGIIVEEASATSTSAQGVELGLMARGAASREVPTLVGRRRPQVGCLEWVPNGLTPSAPGWVTADLERKGRFEEVDRITAPGRPKLAGYLYVPRGNQEDGVGSVGPRLSIGGADGLIACSSWKATIEPGTWRRGCWARIFRSWRYSRPTGDTSGKSLAGYLEDPEKSLEMKEEKEEAKEAPSSPEEATVVRLLHLPQGT